MKNDEVIARDQAGPCCCRAEHFTERELDVLCQVAAGAANDEVAATMNISSHTVSGHLREMLRRSQSRNRAELVARAYAAGILTPQSWPPRRTGRRCLQAPAGIGRPGVVRSTPASHPAASDRPR